MITGQDVVKAVENLETDKKSRPLQPVTISNCGELVLQLKAKGKATLRYIHTLSRLFYYGSKHKGKNLLP